MQYPPEQEPESAPARIARIAVPAFLFLSMITLAFGLGFLVHDLASDAPTAASTASPPSANGNGVQIDGDSVGAAILNEIYEILRTQYVDRETISEDRFRRSAIDGIINSLNDPHTDYLSPEDVASGALDLSSTYQGIGASVSDATGEITIVAPFRDSPAERSGIRSGDVILEVDGVSTAGWSDQEAVQVIRGPAGTTVTLTVRHIDGTVEEISVQRGDILIQSVFTDPALELLPGESGDSLVDRDGTVVDDIAYVNIAQFHDQTLDELRQALADVQNGDYVGLIVDVRSNPGGLLSATVEVVDEFLNEGVILTEVSNDGDRSWEARAGGVAADIPIVVLQDRGSASGAEVLSGAVRDNNRGTVVGTRSFGKGTVNQVRHLQNCGDPGGCGALYLAVGRWLTPSGTEIEGVGVEPDIELEMTQDEYIEFGDIQVFEAIDILRGSR